jgi:Amidohydrolase family
VQPIVTPRFAPSCTEDLLKQLGELAAAESLPIQSHINENKDEIKWVAELFPESKSYADVCCVCVCVCVCILYVVCGACVCLGLDVSCLGLRERE